MRIVIIGAGAIGCIAGGYLRKSGRDAHLIDNNPEVVRKINRDGLQILSHSGRFNVKIQASESIAGFPWKPDDFILLCVKTQYSKEAIDQAADAAGSEIPICCFQNTVQNEVMASKRFKYVYGGIVLYSGNNLAPGKIFHTEGNRVGVGVFPSGLADDKLQSLVQQFKDTGIELYYVDDLMEFKYTKLLMNMTNAPCAIMGLTEPELMNLTEPRQLFDDLLLESKCVLDAAGIKYNEGPLAHKPPDVNAIPKNVPEGLEVICSMHQDLILRRPSTEVDYLNGELVTLGKRYGVSTPINELMGKLVHEMTDRGELPGKYSASDIRNMLNAFRGEKKR